MGLDIAVVIPNDGFPGGALLGIEAALRQHGRPMLVAAPKDGPCRGTDGVSVTAHARIDALDPAKLATLIVVDRSKEVLRDQPALRGLLRGLHAAGKVVCGVGHGVAAVVAAGVLPPGGEVAADEATADAIVRAGAVPLLEPVVSSGAVLTATESGVSSFVEELFGFRYVSTPQDQPLP